MHTATQLNLINRSQDSGDVEIVIFQKNLALSNDPSPIAWRVVQNLGIGDFHPFAFPMQIQASASDAYGNFTPLMDVHAGEQWDMVQTATGTVLQRSQHPAPEPSEVAILNALQQGVIDAHIFRDGKRLALWPNVVPQQRAVFQFNRSLYIGVVSQVQEGEVLNSAIVSTINTEISLLGVASADIVMTGGGPGASATPFRFDLQNVVAQEAVGEDKS